MRRSNKLLDLEYVIPKEHKQEIVVEEAEDVWTPEPEHEHCSACGRSSNNIHLLLLLFKGGDMPS